jgi:hypothetical protein
MHQVKRVMRLGISAIALLATVPAVAADLNSLPVKAPAAPVAAPTWVGGYVGVVAGGTFGNSDHFVSQPIYGAVRPSDRPTLKISNAPSPTCCLTSPRAA